MSPQKKQLTTSQNIIVPWHFMAGVEVLRTIAGRQMLTVSTHCQIWGPAAPSSQKCSATSQASRVHSLCLLPAKGSPCQEQKGLRIRAKQQGSVLLQLDAPKGAWRPALQLCNNACSAAMCHICQRMELPPTAQLSSRI